MTSKRPKHRKRYSITITTAESKKLEANHLQLYKPESNALVTALGAGLAKNYKNVTVELVTCPDLTKWCNLASHGISGNCKLAEVGGKPYLFDKQWQTTTYDLPDIISACGFKDDVALAIGGGQAAVAMIGDNGLAIINSKVPGGPRHSKCVQVIQKQPEPEPKPEPDENSNTNQAQKDDSDEKDTNNNTTTAAETNSNTNNQVEELKTADPVGVEVEEPIQVTSYPTDEHGCASNLFLSDGEPGEVLHIKVSVRTGKLTIIEAIQESLRTLDGCTNEFQIGLGGVIKVLKGKINGMVQRKFLVCDYENDAEKIAEWQKTVECADENLVMFSCLLTGDPSLKGVHQLHLTLNNTFFYSSTKNVNQAGQYVHDTTPDVIEYEAYFSMADSIYRIEDAYYNLSLIKK